MQTCLLSVTNVHDEGSFRTKIGAQVDDDDGGG